MTAFAFGRGIHINGLVPDEVFFPLSGLQIFEEYAINGEEIRNKSQNPCLEAHDQQYRG